MKVILTVELCEKQGFAGKRQVLFKTVEWDAIPAPIGVAMSYGMTEDGESGQISVHDYTVYWDTSGQVNIGLRSENLEEEYDDCRQLALNDGFLEYSDWKKNA